MIDLDDLMPDADLRDCADCGDVFVPEREKQIRCTYCAAVNA